MAWKHWHKENYCSCSWTLASHSLSVVSCLLTLCCIWFALFECRICPSGCLSLNISVKYRWCSMYKYFKQTGLIWQVGSWEGTRDTESQLERQNESVLWEQNGGRKGIPHLCFLTSRITTGYSFLMTSRSLNKCTWECWLAVPHWNVMIY